MEIIHTKVRQLSWLFFILLIGVYVEIYRERRKVDEESEQNENYDFLVLLTKT